ncbi:unnamed protein product [Chilo suppressalis]|uniref:peptidylprolyl isomerase n=1 Tax=Chilo suppressalis TaxID=168631 RepID=A0ABN8BBQ2_CHISP|nr:hypothetical protein evm_000259 [Chilo suppressalis]CAH0404133.1 unnamed protein product [Chilo suppressalis]
MDEVFKDPVQFSKGINLRELMTSATEFHIDMDFKRKSDVLLDDDPFPEIDDGEDSDIEDILKNIEDSTDKLMLSSPEYLSFSELATKMVDCVPSGDAKILIIEEGNGPLVPVDAVVTVHYAAYWEKTKIPFDSTLTMNSGAPITIKLGTGRCLPGLEIGLTTVRGPSARFHLLLQPRLAWGPRGAPPRVRPEPALFVISLYDVKDVHAAIRFNDLPMEEQSKFETTIKTVKVLHSEAKSLFAKKRYKKAIKNYQQSMNVLGLSMPKDENEEAEIKKLKVTVYTNLAVCYCKIDKPKYVFLMCDNIDRISNLDNHCKALFYCGKAHEMLGKHELALKYYKKALKLEPKNREIGKTLAGLDDYVKNSTQKEKELWQTAFKAEPKKEKVVYDVDEVFQNGVRDMCLDLAGREEYAKFDLPTGLTKDEVCCIKSITSDFEGLVVDEDGEGKRKKVSIVKKMI